jgi:spore coat protein U-like protein
MKRLLTLALSAALAATGFDPAIGGTATGDLAVQTTINATCAIEQVPVVDFGTRTSVPAPLDFVFSIGVRCTAGAPYSIALDAGVGVAATTALRRMTGPVQWGYTFFSNASRSMIWGDTAGQLVTGTGTGGLVSHPLYGRVYGQSGSVATPGLYTDTVTITLSF